MPQARACVIFNPASSRGRVRRAFLEVRRFLESHAKFWATINPGHAETLAHDAAQAGYSTVVAAGGDGTVHEVANGILRANNPEVSFGVIPLGSGNDYAAALELPVDPAILCQRLLSGASRQVDVGEVTDEHGNQRFFVNTLGLGLSGAVTWEARQVRGLRGLALYGLAAVRAIWRHFDSPASALHIDDNRMETPTLYLSIAIGQREGGGFVIAPNAKLDDGLFDYLHAGRVSRLGALRYLPGLALGKVPNNDPLVRVGRCRAVKFECEQPVFVHTDGELFPQPGKKCRSLEIRLLPGALKVCGSAGLSNSRRIG